MKKSSRCVATIEARMNSTRFLGKVMRHLAGKPGLERIVERVRRSQEVDEVVIATTNHGSDDVIASWAQKNGVAVFRGSENDVLLRVLEAAGAFHGEIIVELTGDCPLVVPALIDEAVRYYKTHDVDYVCNTSNTAETGYPRGWDVQVFSRKLLAEIDRLTRDPADREHVTLYLHEHPGAFRLATLQAPPELRYPHFRLCVDTPEDFLLVQKIYDALFPRNPYFGAKEIIDFLKRNPDLLTLNQNVKQKASRT